MSTTSLLRSAATQSARSPRPGHPRSRVNSNGLKGDHIESDSQQRKPNSPGVGQSGRKDRHQAREPNEVKKPKATEQETEIQQIAAGQSDPAEAVTNETDGEDEYPEAVRKAFGDKYHNLPHVTGEIISGFTRDDWTALQQWIEKHDDLNRFKFCYDSEQGKLTTMSASDIHNRLCATERSISNDRWYRGFCPPGWVEHALGVSDEQAEYASIRNPSGSKKIADMVEAILVGDKLYVTQLNESAKSQELHHTKGKEGALPKLVDLGDALIGTRKTTPANGDGSEFPPSSPSPASTSTSSGAYTVSSLELDRERYRTLSEKHAGLISDAGPWRTANGAGVKEQWDMDKWVAKGLAIPILESYEGQLKEQLRVFLKKVEDGYKLKLSMVVNLLGLPENARKLAEALGDIVDDDELNARSAEFDEFVDKLLDPQDKHLRLPGEDVLFDAHITQLLKAIKAGTRGTAVQRLVDNTTVENQAEGAVQGGRAAPNPKFQPNNALREQLKSISQMARKRKRSDTVEAELEEDRGRDGPSSSRQQ
ncbi:uncharacterized protein B0H18DRAFT_1126292 [Fomitopsis serialis]|uniref:uncharacterized protein n=1 Tax=Fomitopsis serialis TaxID=139415 RepID=UPI0020075270|nr:uncharacterized protein B0H18DRAFT_1126292 [Neoantrodia serialis]KAH9913389.1 hypothetical protein B0H18DRAFT_1126292 [Neoantrodia serialis]